MTKDFIVMGAVSKVFSPTPKEYYVKTDANCGVNIYDHMCCGGIHYCTGLQINNNKNILIKSDHTDFVGAIYDDDYSANYNARSIPDVGWVTGQTSSSGIHSASNGLTKSGTEVKLGGILTQNTIISGGTFNLSLGSETSNIGNLSTQANTSICSQVGTTNKTYINVACNYVDLYSCVNSTSLSSICIESGAGIGVNTDGATNAIYYTSDYSSKFTKHSLIDKNYVDVNANVVAVCDINTTYTTLRGDDLIAVSGISTNQINLYGTPVVGQRLTVVDVCGNAFSDPIVVNGNGNNINDSGCSTINTDYGSVTYIYNGIFWSAVAFIN